MERADLVVVAAGWLVGCSFPGHLATDAPIDAPATIDSLPPVDAVEMIDAPPGPFWMAVVGAIATDGDLVSTAPTGWGNSGGVTRDRIASGDGYLEFTSSEANRGKALGLSTGDSNQSFNDIDFAFVLGANQRASVYEKGVSWGDVGPYAAGGLFRIEVTAGTVFYRYNGVLVFTSGVAPIYPLLADAAIYTNSGTLIAVRIVDL